MPIAPSSRRILVRSAAIALGIGLAGSLPAAAATHTVAALNYRFGPASLTVCVGDTVRWTFAGEPHSVTSGTPPLPDGRFDSGIIGIDEPRPTFEWTFTTPGTYPYFCQVHSEQMVGKIVVEAAGTPQPTAQPTPTPTSKPTSKPTASPTPRPTPTPAPAPTASAALAPSPTAAPTSSAPASTAAPVSSPSPSPAATDPPAGGSPEPGPSVALPALGVLVLVVGGAIALARRRGA